MTAPTPSTALVVVDVQRDFLARPGLTPSADHLVARVAGLVDAFRIRGLPVMHVQTSTRADGADRMPHWRDRGVTACVEGTVGAEAPDGARPAEGELLVTKQHYRGFVDPEVAPWLRQRGVERVVVCGLYTHACVRETVLDAYEAGFDVWVAADAVATPEPLHGMLTQRWLEARAARFEPLAAVVAALDGESPPAHLLHRDPCDSAQIVTEVPRTGRGDVGRAVDAAAAAQIEWQARRASERAEYLDAWAAVLEDRAEALTAQIVREVAKPQAAAADEVRRAIGHVRTSAALARGDVAAPHEVAPGVAVRHHPVGVIGIVMPWNNPLALPVGKIAPALGFGNAVVCKPAPEGTATAWALRDSLVDAGIPAALLQVVPGEVDTAEALIDAPRVDAIAVTGSVATGRAVVARCGMHAKPLQAELGGNNAVIVLADADLEGIVRPLVRGAYSYSGQRCTAIRRFVVDGSVAARFETLLTAEIGRLVIGDPADPATDVGPLISLAARDRVALVVDDAVRDGARLVCGGRVPDDFTHGAWYAPTLLADVAATARVAQEETFGPVTVLLTVHGVDEAIAVANGVEQGLVAAVCTSDAVARGRVLDALRAGILQVGAGALPVHPDAPFGGWKASGFGPPEHGVWDAAFATRPQAVYGGDGS